MSRRSYNKTIQSLKVSAGFSKKEQNQALKRFAQSVNDLKKVERANGSSYYKPKTISPHTTGTFSSSTRSRAADKMLKELWRKCEHRAFKWANTCVAEFKDTVPVDTGNLRDAIEVLDKDIDKNRGIISFTVGVNSHKVATAPPRHRRATGQGSHKEGNWVTLPKYDYSPFVLGQSNMSRRHGSGVFSASVVKLKTGRGRVSKRRVIISHHGKDYDWTTYDRINTWHKIARKNAKKIVAKK